MVRRHWVGAIGLLLVLVVVGAITLTPTTVDGGSRAEIEQFLAWSHQHGLPSWFVYKQLEFTANIVMFVPVGFFLGLLVSRQWWVTAIAVTALSIVIESAQLLFLPVRFATLSDVIANSLGGWIGLLIAVLVTSTGWLMHRRPKSPAAHQEPEVSTRSNA